MVVYHLQKLSGKSGWNVNGTRLFGSFQWKIFGSNGTSEKVVLFFRTECSKRKFVFHFFNPHLSGFRAHFLSQHNDGKENVTFEMISQSFNFLVIISPTRLTCLM